jgi:hypothetical protein
MYLDSLPQAEADKYWVINLVFNTIKNILFAIGVYIKKSKEHFDSFLTPDPGT